MNPVWFALIAAADIVVTALVVLFVIRRRGDLSSLAGPELQKAIALSREMPAEVEQYLDANWNGDPVSLPGVLTALLDRFEERAREAGATLGRERLKQMLVPMVTAKGRASAHDVREAMRQVA